MFGFACRGVVPCAPWPWQAAAGASGASPDRLPRGLIGGQTVVLLAVWAFALIAGVALVGPPGGDSPEVAAAAPVAAGAPGDSPPAGAAVEPPRPASTAPGRAPSVGPAEPEDAGSDTAGPEDDDPWLGL